jgi:hypothetical protein
MLDLSEQTEFNKLTVCCNEIILENNDSTNETSEVPQEGAHQSQSPAPVALDIKRRMRELLSIPDSQRSDEQWDELIELEIQMAPGNRVGAGGPRENNQPRSQSPRGGGGGGGNPGGGAPGGGGNWKRHGPSRGKHGKPGGGGGPKKPPQPNPAG